MIKGDDKETGPAGKQRVIDHFSEKAFQDRLVLLLSKVEGDGVNVRMHKD